MKSCCIIEISGRVVALDSRPIYRSIEAKRRHAPFCESTRALQRENQSRLKAEPPKVNTHSSTTMDKPFESPHNLLGTESPKYWKTMDLEETLRHLMEVTVLDREVADSLERNRRTIASLKAETQEIKKVCARAKAEIKKAEESLEMAKAAQA